MREEDVETRKKNGYHWTMISGGSHTEYHVEGFTIDNLDTKGADQAESDFERFFIEIREGLKCLESRCLDNESDRLQVCHNLARRLSTKFKKR